MKRKQCSIKTFDFSNYDFSDCVEITGDALYLINGGAKIENSVEAQANAKPSDTVTNSKGETHTLTKGDIDWLRGR